TRLRSYCAGLPEHSGLVGIARTHENSDATTQDDSGHHHERQEDRVAIADESVRRPARGEQDRDKRPDGSEGTLVDANHAITLLQCWREEAPGRPCPLASGSISYRRHCASDRAVVTSMTAVETKRKRSHWPAVDSTVTLHTLAMSSRRVVECG